jgi:hypothetical protein
LTAAELPRNRPSFLRSVCWGSDAARATRQRTPCKRCKLAAHGMQGITEGCRTDIAHATHASNTQAHTHARARTHTHTHLSR